MALRTYGYANTNVITPKPSRKVIPSGAGIATRDLASFFALQLCSTWKFSHFSLALALAELYLFLMDVLPHKQVPNPAVFSKG